MDASVINTYSEVAAERDDGVQYFTVDNYKYTAIATKYYYPSPGYTTCINISI
jgi:hypothetical protein